MINWLKQATWNIRFTPEIEQEIHEIAKATTNFYFANQQTPEIASILNITNPHTKQTYSVNVVILPKSEHQAIAYYEPVAKCLNIIPYNLPRTNNNKIQIFNAFKNVIQHEVAHVLDPKIYRYGPAKGEMGTPEYFNDPTEFDAYSKQIAEDIKMQIKNNPRVKPEIMQWLRSQNTSTPMFLKVYEQILSAWSAKPELMRRFKLRLYNEINVQEIGETHAD